MTNKMKLTKILSGFYQYSHSPKHYFNIKLMDKLWIIESVTEVDFYGKKTTRTKFVDEVRFLTDAVEAITYHLEG